MADLPVGTHVETVAGRGTVKFCGSTHFQVGKWVGIELFEKKGKNDGSVQGQKYFDCKPGYGIFVKRSQVQVAHDAPVVPPSPSTSTPQRAGRPSVSHKRTTSVSASQSGLNLARPGTGTKPSLSTDSSRSGSPAKPTATPSTARPKPILKSIATSRLSATLSRGAIPASPRFTESPTGAPEDRKSNTAVPPPTPKYANSGLSALRSAPLTQKPPSPKTLSPMLMRQTLPQLRETTPPPSDSPRDDRPPPMPGHLLPAPQTVPSEEQELRAKLRVLEAQRRVDEERIRELESRMDEAKQFIEARPRLTAALNKFKQDLSTTERELKDAVAEREQAEVKLVEAGEQLEMAMLDKEMAEDRAENAETELETIKERLAEAEVELKVLNEGSGVPAGDDGVGDDGSGVKSTLAYIQLERQNERLKEALMRLRDMSQEVEHEQRRKIQELERELAASEEIQSDYDATLQKLVNADAQIESLKEQLDATLGAEDMLERLTERNLTMQEKIEEMRIAIEDLEALKELNDELEENHVETEKSLQEEINEKDTELREQARRIEMLEDALLDYESTISQFRELVSQLTSELENLRMQTQNAQTESAMAVSQTATVLSLNLKLQSTASKNQTKNIDLELRKWEAKEGKELLSIVQPYLPQMYIESDSDATNAYLFFQRVAFKADVINASVAQMNGLPESLNGTVTEGLVGTCDMRGRISHFSALCKRFAAVLRRCDPVTFLAMGRLYGEFAPMEKRIDVHINLLRKEEFRTLECVTDIGKMLAQFDHLAETQFAGYDYDLGEKELDLVAAVDHDIDFFAAAVGLAKSHVQAVLEDEDQEVELGEADVQVELVQPIQRLLDQTRAVRGLGKKLLKRIEDLIHESAALRTPVLSKLNQLSTSSAGIVNFGVRLAQLIGDYISSVKEKKEVFYISKISACVREAVQEINGGSAPAAEGIWEVPTQALAALIKEANAAAATALEPESVTRISGKSPWVTRVEAIKSATALNVEAEHKVIKLNEERQELVRTIKAREQTIQETAVKIQVLERRMEAHRKQAETVVDMEEQLKNEKKQVKMYEEAMETLQAEMEALHQDNAKLKQNLANPERQIPGAQHSLETEIVQVEGNLETSHLLEQIESLRGTVRFLRTENGYLKGQDMLRELRSLPPLDVPSKFYVPSSTPPLVPDTGSDDDVPASPRKPRQKVNGEKATTVSRTVHEESPVTGKKETSLRALSTETKLLYRELLDYSASPKMVDLQSLGAAVKKGWVPQRKTAAHQLWERKREGEKLSRRVKGLMERVENVRMTALPS